MGPFLCARTPESVGRKRDVVMNFIDLFAGAGGLSLGLCAAGWTGLWGVEFNPDAFNTYRSNLVDSGLVKWTPHLPCEPADITHVLGGDGLHQIKLMRGSVDLVVGGPPCQGFSIAGNRQRGDGRNQMFWHFLHVVELLDPRFVLLENVSAMGFKFAVWNESAMTHICHQLGKMGYVVDDAVLDSSIFGVPQRRRRQFVVGARKDCVDELTMMRFFHTIQVQADRFRAVRGLNGVVGVGDAIGDLEKRHGVVTDAYGWQMGVRSDHPDTAYQTLMRDASQVPDSHRFPRHSEPVIKKYERIQQTCRAGACLSDQDRHELGIKKNRTFLLDRNLPSCTLTTSPEDIIHYDEPRIMTVRECARLQSFPDSYAFTGPYSTGGKTRRHSCPRYTQVGNSVPPLVAEAIGQELRRLA